MKRSHLTIFQEPKFFLFEDKNLVECFVELETSPNNNVYTGHWKCEPYGEIIKYQNNDGNRTSEFRKSLRKIHILEKI